MNVPCSMESTPAAMAFAMASAPWAWTATFLPGRCAAATTAPSCSVESSVLPGSLAMTPPPTHALITSVPSATSLSTRRDKSAGVVATASPPNTRSHALPGIPIPAPAATMRGPGKRPSRIASRRRRSVCPVEPRLRTVVNPARRVARAASAPATSFDVRCEASVGFHARCVCASMSPGTAHASPRSMTFAPGGMLSVLRGADRRDLALVDQDELVAPQDARSHVEEMPDLDGHGLASRSGVRGRRGREIPAKNQSRARCWSMLIPSDRGCGTQALCLRVNSGRPAASRPEPVADRFATLDYDDC